MVDPDRGEVNSNSFRVAGCCRGAVSECGREQRSTQRVTQAIARTPAWKTADVVHQNQSNNHRGNASRSGCGRW